MPLYYDTGAPTPTSKNSITKTATFYGIRDFLLHKNIQNPIKYPQLSTSINGGPRGGEPVLDTMIGAGVVIGHPSVEIDGIPRYNDAISMNHYKNSVAPSLFDIEYQAKINTTFPNTTSPNGIGDYRQEDILKYGLLPKSNERNFRKISTLKNLYVDATKQIDMADFVSLQPQQTAQQINGYLDEYGGLNLGGSGAVQAADIIGSVLNGQGLGLAKGGIVTNFDIRASLAGRVLTSTGLMKDTKLGVIGAQQLALALANNAAFNSEQLLFGKLNIKENILSLIKNGSLTGFRPDYKITVPSSLGGTILDYTQRILGFNIPRSYMNASGSIFSSENGHIANIERANNLILTTGKGQVSALISNIRASVFGTSPDGFDNPNASFSFFRTGYAPGYKDNSGDKVIDPKGYVFMDAEGSIYSFLSNTNLQCIPEISFNRPKMIDEYGFTGLDDVYGNGHSNIVQPTFSWGGFTTSGATRKPVNSNQSSDQIFRDKKTILGKTQKLFNSFGMKNILSVKGDMTIGDGSQIQTAVVNGGISKGSAVLSGSRFNIDGSFTTASTEANETFCRAWTTYDRYDKVSKLIRHKGLNQNESGGQIYAEGQFRYRTDGSVLDDNGFVKIAPYKTDDISRNATQPKKYMLSIENLAWAGTPEVNLPDCERGPGDLLTGKRGRIMWFPPYEINFTENSSVSIESTNFIGRGEPVYTYNNTERSGTLSFKIIVDHPSIMNSFAGQNGPTDEFIDSYFAGCVDLDPIWASRLSPVEQDRIEQEKVKDKVPAKVVEKIEVPKPFEIYFLNDVTVINTQYESGTSSHVIIDQSFPGIGLYDGEPQRHCTTPNNCTVKSKLNQQDNTDFGLNTKPITIGTTTYQGWIDGGFGAALKNFFEEKCPTCRARITGYASKQGYPDTNKTLGENRAKSVKEYLVNTIGLDTKRVITELGKSGGLTGGNWPNTSRTDAKEPKSQRFARVIIEQDPSKTAVQPDVEIIETTPAANTRINSSIKNRYYNECSFFEKLTDSDPFVFDKIRQKIRYFHPAFHSMTPEGLNARLTFLLQCTRQGPTIPGVEAMNLAFGPPPVCILRVGDFYNTKIMIDNIGFDFEPLVWDLNPEGVGVQPMIANVNISFKFIGGSSLYGPINKLQNALSFNYFANSHVYDPRADYIAASTASTTNFMLVPGIDLTIKGPEPVTKNEVNKEKVSTINNVNQIQSSNNSNTTQQTVQSGSTTNDVSLLKLKITNYDLSKTGFVDYIISRKNNTKTQQLTKDYDLKVSVRNVSGSVLHQFLIEDGFLKNDTAVSNSVNFRGVIPNDLSSTDKWVLTVEFIGSAIKLNKNIN